MRSSSGNRTNERASSPFEIVETTGEEALAKWEELKRAGRGAPVVIGDNIESIITLFHPDLGSKPVSDTLAVAAAIRFPDDLFAMRRVDAEEYQPPLGEWPASAGPPIGLSVAYDIRTGKPHPKVYIAVIPTDDPTTIPAHLRWGDVNDCLAPEYHVAALRDWRDRYGAELVGLNQDTINVRVARKPSTREEALELARVQYAYCNDIVDQGLESYRALAAELMAQDWWFFWWD